MTPWRSGSRAAARRASRSPTRWSPTRTAGCSWSRPRTTRAPRPCRPRACTTRRHYLDALAANGIAADVYDVDARGRTAPDQLGVLSHYKGVIWYTGDDAVTRTAGRGARQRRPPRARRDARDARLHGRGRPRALHGQAGRHAVHRRRASAPSSTTRRTRRPAGPSTPRMDPRRCLVLRGSTQGGDLINDVLQYWFGGMVQIAGDGQDGTTPVRPSTASATRSTGSPWSLTAPASGEHQHVVVRDDERRAAGRRVPAVREPRLGALGEAGRAVRPAHRQQVRLLADRRRDVQAAHA